MPPAGLEPVISTGERSQTHTLDRTATKIRRTKYIEYLYFQILYCKMIYVIIKRGNYIVFLCYYYWGDQNKNLGKCGKYGGVEKYVEGCGGKN
jgi:hypothetical protein